MKFEAYFLDDIRARVPISSLIGTRVSWDRKKTRVNRGDYWACCPFHGEKGASFHCEDKKGRYFCFGCGASGHHFKFLMDLDGVSFPRAVEIVAELAGMSIPNSSAVTPEEQAERDRRAQKRAAADRKRQDQEERDRQRRANSAGSIWKETFLLSGTVGQTYFEWRGLPDPKQENIRFHPGLAYPKEFGDAPGLHPCVIARVQAADGRGVGVWRIYLQPDGCGKLAGVEKPKLGIGPTAGGAVRLDGIAKHIGICEGLETARAVRALGHTLPIWPALSTSGIIGFEFPEGVKTVTVFPDRDAGKIRTQDDGRVKQSPGLEAYRKFVERNPDRDIKLGAGPERDDYLELYQKMTGKPVR